MNYKSVGKSIRLARVVVLVLCLCSCDSSAPGPKATGLAIDTHIRISRPEGQCGDCERVTIDAPEFRPGSTYSVPTAPDVVVRPIDVVVLIPTMQSGESGSTTWSVGIVLKPGVADALNQNVKHLGGSRIAVVSIGEIQRATYLSGVSDTLSLGGFSSRGEIEDSFWGYPVAPHEAKALLGSGSGHDPITDRADKVIDQSEQLRRESKRITRLFEEGAITRDQMIDQLLQAQERLLGHPQPE